MRGYREELFRVSVALGICVVLLAVLSARLAKRDKNISGNKALVLASLPILIQVVREVVGFNLPLDCLLSVLVAVALGYAMVAVVRCTQRTGAFAALLMALIEVPLLTTTIPYWIGETYSGF